MAYDTKSIIKDVNDKPVPQYFNPVTNNYEVINGQDNKLKVTCVDAAGNELNTQGLVDQIALKIDELIGVVI